MNEKQIKTINKLLLTVVVGLVCPFCVPLIDEVEL